MGDIIQNLKSMLFRLLLQSKEAAVLLRLLFLKQEACSTSASPISELKSIGTYYLHFSASRNRSVLRAKHGAKLMCYFSPIRRGSQAEELRHPAATVRREKPLPSPHTRQQKPAQGKSAERDKGIVFTPPTPLTITIKVMS